MTLTTAPRIALDEPTLQLVADAITSTIYAAPFDQATERQRALALTSARTAVLALLKREN